MRQIQPACREQGKGQRLGRHIRLAGVFIVGVACLIDAGIASAAEAAANQVAPRHFPAAQVFTFLFLMLGPFKIIQPFAKITKGADAALTRKIALLATIFASLALLVAAFLGNYFLNSYGIPLPILALAAGLILFLVALLNILQQFVPPESHDAAGAGPAPAPTIREAMTPLAFPTIVTPYGIATLVVFLALSPDQQTQLTVGVITLVIMLLNLMVMLLTRRLLPALGIVLPILGAVLGVVQVALGLQIMSSALKAMGTL